MRAWDRPHSALVDRATWVGPPVRRDADEAGPRHSRPISILLFRKVGLGCNSLRRQDRQSRSRRRLFGFWLFRLAVTAVHSLGHHSLLRGCSDGHSPRKPANWTGISRHPHVWRWHASQSRPTALKRMRLQSTGTDGKAIPHDAGGPTAATSARSRSGMNLEVVRRHFAALAVGYQFEVDLLAFAQVTQTSALHGTDMDECIRPTLIGCDEAEALLGIEPLDGSSRHEKPFQKHRFVHRRRSRLSN